MDGTFPPMTLDQRRRLIARRAELEAQRHRHERARTIIELRAMLSDPCVTEITQHPADPR